MVTLIKSGKQVNVAVGQYCGLSTDTKPTDVTENSLFLELDTGDFYYYTGSAWAKVGG